MQQFYSWIELSKIVGSNSKITSISDAMVNIYDNHKEDLKVLKEIMLGIGRKEYNEMFRKPKKKIANYYSYINAMEVEGDRVDNFHKYVKKQLQNLKIQERSYS